MNIFIGHSSAVDYENDYYKPLELHYKNNSTQFYFPEREKQNTKEAIKNCDLFLAEVTNIRCGLGIEIGWADAFSKPIYLLCKKGAQTSKSLNYLGHKILYYSSTIDFLNCVENIINLFNQQ